MKSIVYIAVLALILSFAQSASLYKCLTSAFDATCKTQLYTCTNDPECSYQLREYTKNIFID